MKGYQACYRSIDVDFSVYVFVCRRRLKWIDYSTLHCTCLNFWCPVDLIMRVYDTNVTKAFVVMRSFYTGNLYVVMRCKLILVTKYTANPTKYERGCVGGLHVAIIKSCFVCVHMTSLSQQKCLYANLSVTPHRTRIQNVIGLYISQNVAIKMNAW